MSDEPSTDKAQSTVEVDACACLNDLEKAGILPRQLLATRSGGGWTVLLVAMPAASVDDRSGLSDCDRDCLAMLLRVTEPLSAARIRRALEKQDIGIYAEITVKRSLTKLRKRGTRPGQLDGHRIVPENGTRFPHPPARPCTSSAFTAATPLRCPRPSPRRCFARPAVRHSASNAVPP